MKIWILYFAFGGGSMNWKSFFIGLGVGLASGYAAKELLSKQTYVSAEKVLNSAKNTFKADGPISGSWIHMKTEPYQKGQLKYEVYKGGISRQLNGAYEQYEFIADARTGVILDAYQIG